MDNDGIRRKSWKRQTINSMYETNYKKYIGKNSYKNLKVKLVNREEWKIVQII